MIKLKHCKVGDVVRGAYHNVPFTDATVLTLDCTGYPCGDYVLLGWKNNRPNFSYVPSGAIINDQGVVNLNGCSGVYWVFGDTDVDIISGAPQNLAMFIQALAIHCCNSWLGCMESACVCVCVDCVKARGSASPGVNVATKEIKPEGMNCAIASCNTYNEYVEPNQPDGVSFICYSCRSAGRRIR